MITSMDIYWIMQMDSFAKFFGIVGTIILVVGIPVFIGAIITISEGDEKIGKLLFKIGLPFTFFGLLFIATATFIPSTKTLAAMYTVPAVVNSEKAAKLGTDSIEVLELGLARLKEVLKKEAE